MEDGKCYKTGKDKMTAQMKMECPEGYHDEDGVRCAKSVTTVSAPLPLCQRKTLTKKSLFK